MPHELSKAAQQLLRYLQQGCTCTRPVGGPRWAVKSATGVLLFTTRTPVVLGLLSHHLAYITEYSDEATGLRYDKLTLAKGV